MALDILTGYTDDGLVFMKFEGAPDQAVVCPKCKTKLGPNQSTVTLECDMAADMAKKLAQAADRARLLNKRPLHLGQPQTFKKIG